MIWLRTGTRRVIFDDDRAIDLKQRAYSIGRTMKKPVEVTREDAEKLVPPEEPDEEASGG